VRLAQWASGAVLVFAGGGLLRGARGGWSDGRRHRGPPGSVARPFVLACSHGAVRELCGMTNATAATSSPTVRGMSA